MDLFEIIEHSPDDIIITDALVLLFDKLKKYDCIACSVSGGSDSDLLVDMCTKADQEHKVRYVFFDTGLEYAATKEHLNYLEQKYNITIEWERAVLPIPTCCKKYGQPFLSKQVSEFISRLQRHNFKWEDKPFEELLKEYPKCKAALRWWCNDFADRKNGSGSSHNIAYHKWLKEFMIINPPPYFISNKCCHYAKKEVAKRYKKANNIDLSIVGVRKAEGGARAAAYKNCFSANDDVADEFRPIFWFKAENKNTYENHYNLKHSRCYSEYGLKRTGCAGCPYGRDFEAELEVIKKHEPKLYKAVNNIFGESYEYTRAYREFVKQKNAEKILN